MFLVSTRNFPPDIGGIQNLMEGLSNALLNHGPVKVFADNFENSEEYDLNSKLSIQRVSGLKIFKKYRKANLIKEFINENDLRAAFFDHWKSIENINISILSKTKSFCLIHSKEINHPLGSSLNKRMLDALNKADHVIANSQFTGKEITLSFAKEALNDLISLQNKMVTIDNIQKTVSDYYKIRISDLLSAKRNRSLARPRQLAMSLAKELTSHSLPEIGDAFGGRDHTTVLHACKKVIELAASDNKIKEDLINLRRSLST